MAVTLEFERDYEFAPVIAWDALVDADLVSGWLAEAVIDPRVGGGYTLRWANRVGQPETHGEITALRPGELLQVDTPNMGRIRFELRELAGGSRGTSTRLRLVVEMVVEPVFLARVKADWLTALDQLEDLLRGHPVDWAHWRRDRHDDWSRHLGEIENSTA